MAKINIQPMGTRILIKPLEQESKTSSGLLLPETAKEKPQTGVVDPRIWTVFLGFVRG